MRKLSMVVLSAVVQACSPPSSSYGVLVPEAPGPVQPLAKPAAVASGALPVDSAPHVFTPRPHSARPRFIAGPVDPSRLPVLKTTSCFGHAPGSAVLSQSPSRKVRATGRLGGAHSVGSGAGRSYSAASKPKAAAPRAPAAAPAPPAAESEGYGYSFDAPREERPQTPPHPSKKASPKDEVARGAVQRTDEAPKAGAYHDFGASIYLSNDDTMSLSSAQRVLYAIDRFLPIPSEHVRPHELLNYFSFETKPVLPTHDFSVAAEIEPKPGEAGVYTLALSVSGRAVSKDERRNAALTFVIDRSGSMEAEGRMEYLKRGLKRMTSELKRGDMVQLVLFDDEVCVPVEDFVVGRDSMHLLTSTIERIAPRGATDIDSGLRRGYAIADRSYQSTHSNRVVLVTDALANTGVTNPEVISMISGHYDRRRIRLSGVGVGSEFNDGLLDRLTERGKGAYVFLGSDAEVDAVFGERFVSLIETVANDVHFRLHLPPSLGMNVFYGEESSTKKTDVQAIHYFAGTSQLFLSDLAARGGTLRPQDSVMLSVEYEQAETGTPQVEEYAFTLGDITGRGNLVEKGRLVMSFIDGIADTIQGSPSRAERRAGGWVDSNASEQCERGRASLAEQGRVLSGDPEVSRILSLWDTYCSRYEVQRDPVRRTPPRGSDVWPSARR